MTITVCWSVEINYQNRQWLIGMLVNCLPTKSTSLWTKTMVTTVSTGVVLIVVVVQRKERNAMVMGETREGLFLNVLWSWISIYIATFWYLWTRIILQISLYVSFSKGPSTLDFFRFCSEWNKICCAFFKRLLWMHRLTWKPASRCPMVVLRRVRGLSWDLTNAMQFDIPFKTAMQRSWWHDRGLNPFFFK